jgi:hypothetical protein
VGTAYDCCKSRLVTEQLHHGVEEVALIKRVIPAAVIFLSVFVTLRSVVFCLSDSVSKVKEFVANDQTLPKQRVLAGFTVVDFHALSSAGLFVFHLKENAWKYKQDFRMLNISEIDSVRSVSSESLC